MSYLETKQRELDDKYATVERVCLCALSALKPFVLPELVTHILLDMKLLYMRDGAVVGCGLAEKCHCDDLMLQVPDWPQPHTLLRLEVNLTLVFSPRDDRVSMVSVMITAALRVLMSHKPDLRFALRGSGDPGLCWEDRVALFWVKINLAADLETDAEAPVLKQLLIDMRAAARAAVGQRVTPLIQFQ